MKNDQETAQLSSDILRTVWNILVRLPLSCESVQRWSADLFIRQALLD